MKLLFPQTLILAFLVSSANFALGKNKKHDHKVQKNCEVTKEGKVNHLSGVKSRRDCKKKGGRWVASHKKDDHKDHADHKDHSGHNKGKDHKHDH